MKDKYESLPRSPYAKSKRGFVYILKLGNKFKIGTTINLRSRIKAIDSYMKRHGKVSVEVVHFFIAQDGNRTESQLHQYFRDKRTESETGSVPQWRSRIKDANNSEWFNLDSNDVEYIKSFGDE